MLKELLNRQDSAWKRDIASRTPEGWYGLATPSGWDSLVKDLHQEIVVRYPEYQVFQIKEKFGELRYYCSVKGDAVVRGLINAASEKSVRTCQVCGSPGTFSEKPGSVRVLCTEHDNRDDHHNGYVWPMPRRGLLFKLRSLSIFQ